MGRKQSDNLNDLPEGVEIHGKKLRIVFRYKGQRCREGLGLFPTNKNIKYAEGLRATVLHEIATNTFSYPKRFPNSSRAYSFGNSEEQIIDITLGEMIRQYKKSRNIDLYYSSQATLKSNLKTLTKILGGKKILVSSLKPSDLSAMRTEVKEGRLNSSANQLLSLLKNLLAYAKDNQFTRFDFAPKLKRLGENFEEDIPDPFEHEEFEKILRFLPNDFYREIFTFSVYTGMRIGEVIALSWSDVNFKDGTLTVRRNCSRYGFKPPKNYKSRRIELFPPAFEVLKKMRLRTALMPEVVVPVTQRDKSIVKNEKLRFVFNPLCMEQKGRGRRYINSWLSYSSYGRLWRNTIKKSGVRHRRYHQTRHTYACWILAASGNPAYVADQLGHKDLAMVSRVYAKWMPSNSARESDRIWQSMNARDSSSENTAESNE